MVPATSLEERIGMRKCVSPTIGSILICATLVLPVQSLAQGFDYNDVATVDPETFAANQHATGIIGKTAMSSDGRDVGEVVDIVFDDTDAVRGYIVDVGGFLGLDPTPLYIPSSLASIRIDGANADLELDMLADDVATDARLD